MPLAITPVQVAVRAHLGTLRGPITPLAAHLLHLTPSVIPGQVLVRLEIRIRKQVRLGTPGLEQTPLATQTLVLIHSATVELRQILLVLMELVDLGIQVVGRMPSGQGVEQVDPTSLGTAQMQQVRSGIQPLGPMHMEPLETALAPIPFFPLRTIILTLWQAVQ